MIGPVRGATMRRPPRVALLLDSPTVPAWIQRVLAEIRASDTARLVAVLLDGSGGRTAPRREPALSRVLRRLDRCWFAMDDDPMRPTDATPLLDGAGPLRVVP